MPALGAVVPELDDEGATELADPRDYDVAHYERVLRDTFAARLARAFTPEDFAVVFADPDQPPCSRRRSTRFAPF